MSSSILQLSVLWFTSSLGYLEYFRATRRSKLRFHSTSVYTYYLGPAWQISSSVQGRSYRDGFTCQTCHGYFHHPFRKPTFTLETSVPRTWTMPIAYHGSSTTQLTALLSMRRYDLLVWFDGLKTVAIRTLHTITSFPFSIRASILPDPWIKNRRKEPLIRQPPFYKFTFLPCYTSRVDSLPSIQFPESPPTEARWITI